MAGYRAMVYGRFSFDQLAVAIAGRDVDGIRGCRHPYSSALGLTPS
jgi:hypothetical protein